MARYGTPATRDLCAQVADLAEGTATLGFSRGKDALASLLFMREFFPTIVPFHCASIPHLGFVDRSLAYYEQALGIKIERCLSGASTGALANLVYQAPEDEAEIDAMAWRQYTNQDVARILRRKHRIPYAWEAYGISLTDSIDRRTRLLSSGGLGQGFRTFHPCFDWTRAQILGIIADHGLKLAPDYRFSSRSVAGGPNLRSLAHMEEAYPDDFRRYQEMFPFCRAAILRNQWKPPGKKRGPKPKGTPCPS